MDGSAALGDVAYQEGEHRQQQSQLHDIHTHATSPHRVDSTHLHDRTMDDSEDYGPLKKKHKYRDERDKERSGSFSNSQNDIAKQSGADGSDEVMTLDASLHIDDVSHDAASGGLAEPSKNGTSGPPASSHSNEDHQQMQSQRDQSAQQEQQQHEDSASHTDLASSPGSTSEKNRRHKHNFYVPSRELAMLLDSGAAAAAAGGGSGSSASGLGAGSTASKSDSEHNSGLSLGESPAAAASSLLAGAGAITGRQAQKIAAMEAKEQARLQKEKEAEELRTKKRLEAEKKKAETARRKAEKEQKAAAAAASAAVPSLPPTAVVDTSSAYPAAILPPSSSDTPLAPSAGAVKAKKKPASRPKPSSEARASASGNSPAVAPSAAPSIGPIPMTEGTAITKTTSGETTVVAPPPSNGNGKDVKPKKAPARRPAKPKVPKQSSPELPVAQEVRSPEVKFSSTGLAATPAALPTTARFSSPGDIPLPPLPDPAPAGDEADVLGFIPYASEGARAAALAKAAKQKAAAAGALPPKSTSSTNGTPANGGPTGSTNSNKRAKGDGKSRSATSKAKAAGGSGRASPVAGFEQLNHGTGDGAASTSTAQAASGNTAVEEEEADDRLYCICQQLYDEDRLMIACDRCDNWYHTDCINIDEASIELIDLFICPICEKDTNRRTVYKPACAREGCSQPALKLSKYCSDWCGVTVAAAKLGGRRTKGPQNLDILWDAVSSVNKLETIIKTVSQHDGDRSDDIEEGSQPRRGPSDLERVEEEEQRLETLQASLSDLLANREEVESTIALADARLAYYAVAKARWRRMRDRHVEQHQNKPSASTKKVKNSKASKAAKAARATREAREAKEGQDSDDDKAPPDAPCGFDVRLVWSDRVFQSWLDSDEAKVLMAAPAVSTGSNTGQVNDASEAEVPDTTEEEQAEGVICTNTRRRCDRHAGWQTMRKQDYNTEKRTAVKRLNMLVETERRTRERLEDVQKLLAALRRKTGRDGPIDQHAEELESAAVQDEAEHVPEVAAAPAGDDTSMQVDADGILVEDTSTVVV